MNIIKEKIRTTNLIDIFRIFAAFAVVWYHSSYYSAFNGFDKHLIDLLKLLLISFSMPFFYAIMAKFSLISAYKNDFAKVWIRIKSILFIMVILTSIYVAETYILHLIFPASPFDFPGLSNAMNNMILVIKQLIYTVRYVDNTPGYYLANVIYVAIITYFMGLIFKSNFQKKVLATCLILFITYVIFFVKQNTAYFISTMFMTWRDIAYCCVGLVYYLIFPKGIKLFELKTTKGVLMTSILTILLVGTCFLFHHKYRITNPIYLGLVMLATFVCVIIVDQRIAVKSKLLDFLSYIGQKYSLGIFIFHMFIFKIIDIEAFSLTRHCLNNHPSIFLYIILNVMAFLGALGLTEFSYSVCPKIVKLK